MYVSRMVCHADKDRVNVHSRMRISSNREQLVARATRIEALGWELIWEGRATACSAGDGIRRPRKGHR